MPYNIPVIHEIKEIIQETPRVKTFKFCSPGITQEAKPGQFVMVWNPRVDEIPISIAYADERGNLELAIAKAGDCTKDLHKKRVGDRLGLRGPYGRGFNLEGENFCFVCGGYGSAPLRYAAKEVRKEDKEVTVLIGARTVSELLYVDRFEKLGCEVEIATEDGSEGYRGLVTDLLKRYLKRERERVDQVLTCGPELMMREVCKITRKYGIKTQLSVERIIKCSCGACGSCDLGGYRVCKDGPVFYAEELENTEFARWRRDKSGKRIPLEGLEKVNFSLPPLPDLKPEFDPMLEIELFGIKFPNPLMNAAGFGVSGRLLYRYAKAGAGAVVTKSIGLKEEKGYPNPTFLEISHLTYVNAMGLPNPGIKNYKPEIEDAKHANVPIILSIYGKTPDEYEEVARIGASYGISMFEVNVSCPHTELASIESDPELVKEVTRKVVKVAKLRKIPVSVKISPNVDYIETADAAFKGGANAITAINTKRVRPLNYVLNIPILGNPTGFGGMSGKEHAQLGKEIVSELYREFEKPIIAVGGIFSATDVIDYAKNGACLFQIGSALVSEGMEIFRKIKEDLREYLRKNNFSNLSELRG